MSVSKSVVCLLLLCGVGQVFASSDRSEKVVGTVCKVRDHGKLENAEKENAQPAATPEVKKEIPVIPYSRRAKRDTETLECYVCDSTTDTIPKKEQGVKSADVAPVPAPVAEKALESVPEDPFEDEAEPAEQQAEKSNRGDHKRAPTTCCIIKHEKASIINSTPAIQETCNPLSDTECSFSKTSWIGQFAISAESALI